MYHATVAEMLAFCIPVAKSKPTLEMEEFRCAARVWNSGLGAQCPRRRRNREGAALCKYHEKKGTPHGFITEAWENEAEAPPEVRPTCSGWMEDEPGSTTCPRPKEAQLPPPLPLRRFFIHKMRSPGVPGPCCEALLRATLHRGGMLPCGEDGELRECDLLWTNAFPPSSMLAKLPQDGRTVYVNRFPRSTELSHKDRLQYSLRAGAAVDTAPQTFVLPAEKEAFFAAAAAAAECEPAGIWIAKATAAGEGRGTFLCRWPLHEDVRARLLERPQVVSSYIQEPLLVDCRGDLLPRGIHRAAGGLGEGTQEGGGHEGIAEGGGDVFKIDLRVYVCVTSWRAEEMEAWVFREGLVTPTPTAL